MKKFENKKVKRRDRNNIKALLIIEGKMVRKSRRRKKTVKGGVGEKEVGGEN